MKRSLALIASLTALLPAMATTVWKVNGTGGWNSASQWDNGVPGTGNPAKFENVTLTFTDSDVANLNSAKIVPAAGATLVFDFANDQEIVSDIQLQTTSSKIVKRGAGNLTLTGDSYSFYGEGCVSVENGIVYAPKVSAYLDGKIYPCLEVKSPGQLVLPGDRRVYVRGLLGDGTITSATAMSSSNFLVVMGDVQTNHYEFSGTIGAGVYLKFGDHRSDYRDFCANQLLSCSYGGALAGFDAYNGNVGVRSFGDGADNPGSLGYGTAFITYGAQYATDVGFTYEGTTGETSARDLQFRGQSIGADSTFYVDAGPYGGLEFTGEWKTANSGTNNEMYRLCLRGDNEMPCTFSGKLTPMQAAYDVVLTKQGTGTWNLTCGNKNTLRGPVHVERGTLGYNTVGGINVDCALGRATMLQTNFLDAAEAPAVPYTVKIGNGSNDTAIAGLATLNYLGSTAVNMSVRPVTLDGAGAFSGTSGVPMSWSGFAAAPAGGTLVLDGVAGDGGKIAKNLVDGEGVLSVEKRGEGTWTIMGNNAFSGNVRVKAGKLVAIGDNAWYTWVRWTLKNMLAQPSSSNPGLQEIALYDTVGVRQNAGLDYQWTGEYYPARVAADLPPSSVTYGATGYYSMSAANRDLDCCFDDSIATPKNVGWFVSCYPGRSSNQYPNGTDANAWQVVMHLGSPVPKIAQYDFCGANVFNSTRAPGSWTWEGSHDGQTWDPLVDYTLTLESGATLSGNRWMGRRLQSGGGEQFEPGRVLTAEDTGFPMRGYSNETGTSPLGTASVRVDPGATLIANGAVTISKLVVDATTGAGTLDGITLDTAGTIDLVGVTSSSQAYDFSIGAANGTDLSRLEGWTLTVGGKSTGRKFVYLGGGNFRLYPSGLMLIVL